LAELTRSVQEPLLMVAQVHTHPSWDTEHSRCDDERAASRKILSIVLPDYGDGAEVTEAGWHEFRNDQWERLDRSEIKERLRIIPASLDARSER